MYVTDSSYHHIIQVFNQGGMFLRQICIDGEDTVYVVEGNNHQVSVFTCEGKFLTPFGRKGDEPGCFNSPRGITVDKNEIICVSDSGNNHIQIY